MNMTSPRTTGLLATIGVLTLFVLMPEIAKADHRFEYDGPRYGFHGEAHLVNALHYLDLGYRTPDPHGQLLVYATRELYRAAYGVCQPRSAHLISAAIRQIGCYQYGGSPVYLDTAARLINQALYVERAYHVRPVALRPSYGAWLTHHGGPYVTRRRPYFRP